MFDLFPFVINDLTVEPTPIKLYLQSGGGDIFYKFLISLSFSL